MPPRFSPLSDSLSGSAWQHARRRQLAGLDVGAEALQQGLSDDLPIEQWLLVRDRQVRGQAPVGALQKATPLRSDRDMAASLQVAASTGAKPATGVKQPPLTGRPGMAVGVARVVNTIAGGPNTTADLHEDGLRGTFRRGAGRDFQGEGKVLGFYPVGVTGTLNPPTGRPEVSAAGVRGHGAKLPDRIRIYNTPTGELDAELSGPLSVGPFRIRKGVYVIGQPDPPKRR